MSRYLGTLLAVVLVAVMAAHAAASTEFIISDNFTGTDNTDIGGRTPDLADLPGTTWSTAGQGVQILSNRAKDIGDGAAGVHIASAGAYTKPTLFTISADEDLGPSAAAHPVGSYGDGASIFGLRLGFFAVDPATPNGGGYRGGVGIIYTVSQTDSGNGELLLLDGQTTYADLGSTGFSTTGSYHLSYTIDTTTGTITGLTFNGVPITVPATATFTTTPGGSTTPGVSTAIFTDAATNWAGIYQRADSTDTIEAYADNFAVTTEVPEPASLALLIAGGAMLLHRRRNRVRTPFTVSRNVGILVSALAVLMAITAGASATTEVLDTFDDAGTASTGTSLTGRTPTPIDIPGSTYLTYLGQGGAINGSGQAVIGADSRVILDISSLNAIGPVTISANLRYDAESGDTPANGAALGFWSDNNGGNGNGLAHFTGVALGLAANGDGELNLMSGATFNVIDSIDLGATFNNAAIHLLTYNISRTSDTITGLTLDGTPYTFSNNAAVFTLANTQFAGFGGHGVLGNDTETFDNFTLTVPEPASLGLLVLGGAMLLRRRR